MRIVTGILLSVLTAALCWFLDGKRTDAVSIGLGRFLDPFGGIWQNAEAPDAYQDDAMELEGPKGSIEIVYDDRRVPHVFAETEEDLYFGQGFATARDRLWQMEFQVRAAGGRLAEVIDNPRVIPIDRLERRKGMVVAAQRSVEGFEKDPTCKKVLDAYTAGVNAYIATLSPSEYPFEYKLLEYAPEPWTNLKTAILLKRMAWNLTGRTYDFENSNTLAEVGWDTYKSYFPMTADSVSPIIPRTHQWDFEPLPIPDAPADSIPVKVVNNLRYAQPDANNGSNNWAVHGSKTKDGYPILCNDPHLGLSLPAIWYEIQLHGPGVNAYGASLPGSPGIIIGFNEDIAWGMTNAARDVVDYYQIEFKDEKREEYKYNGGWKKVEQKVEEIKLKNGDVILDTVLWTHHGPVVYDKNFGDEHDPQNVAMRWIAHDPALEYLTFHLLNRGKNHADYRKALTHFACPGQNFVFASRGGDVAITQQGKFVNKWEGQGLFVMDGSNPDHEWQGYIPNAHNPHVKNPPRGFVSSANQHAVDTTYPYRIDGFYSLARGRRINQALAGMNGVTVQDMMQLQNDNYNQMASETLPGFLKALEGESLGEKEKAIVQELSDWNYLNEAGMIAPIYFQWWSNSLHDQFAGVLALSDPDHSNTPTTYASLHHISVGAHDTASAFRDRFREFVLNGLKDVVQKEAEWKQDNPELPFEWYAVNSATVEHLARLQPFSYYGLNTGGNGRSVNAIRGRHGPSWRMIVELGPEVKAYGMYPGGPSGNPGSPWYDNQIAPWTEGQYQQIHFFKDGSDAKAASTSTLELKPEN